MSDEKTKVEEDGKQLTEEEMEQVTGGITPADQAPGPDPADPNNPGPMASTSVGSGGFQMGDPNPDA